MFPLYLYAVFVLAHLCVLSFRDTAGQARALELGREEPRYSRSPSSRRPNTAAVLLILFEFFSRGIKYHHPSAELIRYYLMGALYMFV